MTAPANPWPPQLILDIALESHSPDELLIKHSLDKDELDRFYTIPQFCREILHARAELASSGSQFRAHARVMAEEHLLTMNDIMNDPDTPKTLKIELWKSLVEYAKLKPPKETVDPASTGHNLTINIAGFAAAPPVAGPRPVPVIDVTPENKCLP
jgi:uncharacterized protein (UPF0147 family)